MKWLRSSLFKNNSDTFVFEENINVKVEHYDNSLKDIRDVVVSGKLTRDVGARNATLSIMAGGDKKVFKEVVLPLVEKLGKSITYFGEAGKGQYAKLANQIAIATTMISVAESFKFAKEVGLDLDSFFKQYQQDLEEASQ